MVWKREGYSGTVRKSRVKVTCMNSLGFETVLLFYYFTLSATKLKCAFLLQNLLAKNAIAPPLDLSPSHQ